MEEELEEVRGEGEEMLSVFKSLPFRRRLSSIIAGWTTAGGGGGGFVAAATTASGRLIGQSNKQRNTKSNKQQRIRSD